MRAEIEVGVKSNPQDAWIAVERQDRILKRDGRMRMRLMSV